MGSFTQLQKYSRCFWLADGDVGDGNCAIVSAMERTFAIIDTHRLTTHAVICIILSSE